MGARARRAAALATAAVVVAAVLVSSGTAGVRKSGASTAPTLYFMYSMNCTFSIVDDAGRTISSIPPGNYQVDVRTPIQFGTLPLPSSPTDMTACRGFPQFQLTGPGVDLFTTMTAGCEDDKVFPETFQPNATYVAQDLNQPSVARASFTTLASGAPAAASASFGGGKARAEVSTDIVGSLAVAGTLKATVSAAGKPTLTRSGKPVTSVPAGRYKFAISDRDRKGSFKLLGPTSKAPASLSGAAFRGSRSVLVKLTVGRWTYYTNLGTVHYFRVTRAG